MPPYPAAATCAVYQCPVFGHSFRGTPRNETLLPNETLLSERVFDGVHMGEEEGGPIREKEEGEEGGEWGMWRGGGGGACM